MTLIDEIVRTLMAGYVESTPGFDGTVSTRHASFDAVSMPKDTWYALLKDAGVMGPPVEPYMYKIVGVPVLFNGDPDDKGIHYLKRIKT